MLCCLSTVSTVLFHLSSPPAWIQSLWAASCCPTLLPPGRWSTLRVTSEQGLLWESVWPFLPLSEVPFPWERNLPTKPRSFCWPPQRSAVASRIHPPLVLFYHWISIYLAEVIVKWSFPALTGRYLLSYPTSSSSVAARWPRGILLLWFPGFDFVCSQPYRKATVQPAQETQRSYGLWQQPDEIRPSTQE